MHNLFSGFYAKEDETLSSISVTRRTATNTSSGDVTDCFFGISKNFIPVLA